MLKLLVSIFAIIYSVTLASAHYRVHSSTSGVQIESNGKSIPAKQGEELKANDYLFIPEGGEVEIYNDLEKKIYKSLSSGKISVTKLMIEAKKTASDNKKNVISRLSLAKNQNTGSEGERIYIEKGMVRRSLTIFDPEADNLQVNSKSLGKMIARYISGKDSTGYHNVAVNVSKGIIDSIGMFFRIVNTLEFPIYFNVLKYDSNTEQNEHKIEISVLGQPDGSYVLLPGQALARENFNPLPTDEKHLLVVTHIRYDLDEVVEETCDALNNLNPGENEFPSIPLLIMNL